MRENKNIYMSFERYQVHTTQFIGQSQRLSINKIFFHLSSSHTPLNSSILFQTMQEINKSNLSIAKLYKQLQNKQVEFYLIYLLLLEGMKQSSQKSFLPKSFMKLQISDNIIKKKTSQNEENINRIKAAKYKQSKRLFLNYKNHQNWNNMKVLQESNTLTQLTKNLKFLCNQKQLSLSFSLLH
ncbi:hypothetical protein ABPG72_014466 [Tetrahymena utriculariae]